MKKFTMLVAVATLSISLDAQAQGDKKQGDTPKAPEWFAKMDKNHNGELTEDEVGRGWRRIVTLDKDGDGVVTLTEAASRGKAKVEKADKVGDKDGKGKRVGMDRRGAVAGLFTRYDKNKDGALSQDEAGKAWDRIKGLDTDKNGSVSTEEAAVIAKRGSDQAKKGKDQVKKAMEHGDKAKDHAEKAMEHGEKAKDRAGDKAKKSVGDVKKLEKDGKDRIAGLFARVDKDHDGKITQDEAGDLWKRLSARDANGDGAVTAEELAGKKGDKKTDGGEVRRKRDGR